MTTRFRISLAAAMLAGGCTRGDGARSPRELSPVGPVPEYAQRPGDPVAGYDTLVNEGYVSCGIPLSVWDRLQAEAPTEIPGRTGRNATLPYSLTAFNSPRSDVELVSANCLTCHAAYFDGELVVGLGNESTDYTDDFSFYAELIGGLVTDPEERVEWRLWADRVGAIAPYSRTHTVGANPADNLTAAIFAHLDPVTLEWSEELRMEPPPEYVVPSSPPPWWWMRKKHGMFYTTSGRGDHTRFMMLASSLCSEGVAEAAAINGIFDDVRAWIAELEPPAWPFAAPDRALAREGERVFQATCSRCHGTYGPAGVYPNLVVALDEIGTDPLIAEGATTNTDRFLDWFEESWYADGGAAMLSPAPGYIAPPLDGVWATAPYLHNGSVPTIAALLDSPSRPRYWTRTFDSTDYDADALGWHFTTLDHGKDGEPDSSVRARIYDTTQPGYSNSGHTFGDVLDDASRRAVLEYLKTL